MVEIWHVRLRNYFEDNDRNLARNLCLMINEKWTELLLLLAFSLFMIYRIS